MYIYKINRETEDGSQHSNAPAPFLTYKLGKFLRHSRKKLVTQNLLKGGGMRLYVSFFFSFYVYIAEHNFDLCDKEYDFIFLEYSKMKNKWSIL